jgi:hypothetical protein
MEVMGGTPAQFTDFMKAEIDKWGHVAKTANIKME